MAQRVITTLVDDLDESEATETVSFTLNGNAYEIDLNDEHAGQLRDLFAPYIGAARRAAGPTTRRRTGSTSSPKPTGASRGGSAESGSRVQQIREWGRANGYQVNERGRLSGALVQAYEEAHA